MCLVLGREDFSNHLGSLMEIIDRDLGLRVLASIPQLHKLSEDERSRAVRAFKTVSFPKGSILLEAVCRRLLAGIVNLFLTCCSSPLPSARALRMPPSLWSRTATLSLVMAKSSMLVRRHKAPHPFVSHLPPPPHCAGPIVLPFQATSSASRRCPRMSW